MPCITRVQEPSFKHQASLHRASSRTCRTCSAQPRTSYARAVPKSHCTRLFTRVLHPRRRFCCKAGAACRASKTAAAAASPNSSDATPAAAWDSKTEQYVSLATLPFILLLVPQMIKNTMNYCAGNSGALAILSWLGYATALGGNALLLSYFLGRKERGAAIIQALGVASNALVLTQIYLAGFMPPQTWALLAGATALAMAVNGAKAAGALEGGPRAAAGAVGPVLWSAWGSALAVLGLVGVPQALWGTFYPNNPSLLPGRFFGALGVALLLLHRARRLPPGLWPALPGWTATALFMIQPIAQLAANVRNPAGLAGLSAQSISLAVAGNALMLPRAAWTGDAVWMTGSAWGSAMGWAQLLSLVLGRDPVSGARYFPVPLFVALSAGLAAFLFHAYRQQSQARQATAAH